MLKTLGAIAIVLFMLLPGAVLLAGQMNLLSGRRPPDLGAKGGMLKAPAENAWNSVSSQSDRHPHNEYHRIEPLRYNGDGHAALRKLEAIVHSMPGAVVVDARSDYLYAEFRTSWLKFVDDVEFMLDAPTGVIHWRSASRLGRKDFGVNRKRLETIRERFNASPAASLPAA